MPPTKTNPTPEDTAAVIAMWAPVVGDFAMLVKEFIAVNLRTLLRGECGMTPDERRRLAGECKKYFTDAEFAAIEAECGRP